MWWAGSKAHDVYLGTRAVAVCLGDEVVLGPKAVEGLPAGLAVLSSWLAEAGSRCRLRVWLSGGLCRPFIAPAVPGVKTRAEVRQVAESIAAQRTGLTGECHVWLDHGKLHEACVAVAVHRASLQQLQDCVGPKPYQHRIISIRPWWSEVLRTQLRRHAEIPAMAVQDCDSLTVLAGAGQSFEMATTLAPVTDCETADAALARILLSAGVEAQVSVTRLATAAALSRRPESSSSNSELNSALASLTEWSA